MSYAIGFVAWIGLSLVLAIVVGNLLQMRFDRRKYLLDVARRRRERDRATLL